MPYFFFDSGHFARFSFIYPSIHLWHSRFLRSRAAFPGNASRGTEKKEFCERESWKKGEREGEKKKEENYSLVSPCEEKGKKGNEALPTTRNVYVCVCVCVCGRSN